MRLLAAVILLALVSACNSESGAAPRGRIVVVDPSGEPIQGAILIPDSEDATAAPTKFDRDEIKKHASDAQGVIPTSLDRCLWEGDGCYHFRIHRAGFEDSAMVVSKDLFPPVLRIVLRPPPGS